MSILVVMFAGVLVGALVFPEKYKKHNELLQVVCTVLLIFSMGVMLGRREGFLQQLASMGLLSLLFAVASIAASTVLVFLLTRWLMDKKKGGT